MADRAHNAWFKAPVVPQSGWPPVAPQSIWSPVVPPSYRTFHKLGTSYRQFGDFCMYPWFFVCHMYISENIATILVLLVSHVHKRIYRYNNGSSCVTCGFTRIFFVHIHKMQMPISGSENVLCIRRLNSLPAMMPRLHMGLTRTN